MNIIGEIQLGSDIKILDALDFPEQFSLVTLSNIQEGLWLALNETTEDEMMGDIVSQFVMVEKDYYQQNDDIEQYDWNKQDEIISIEKGIIGIYGVNFYGDENYREELDDAVSNDNHACVLTNYVACKTPFGNDDNFSFDIVKHNGKIVAIQFNLNVDN
jgi:hypothetical protein